MESDHFFIIIDYFCICNIMLGSFFVELFFSSDLTNRTPSEISIGYLGYFNTRTSYTFLNCIVFFYIFPPFSSLTLLDTVLLAAPGMVTSRTVVVGEEGFRETLLSVGFDLSSLKWP